MIYKKGTYILSKQPGWMKFRTCLLLAKDWDPSKDGLIPYIQEWSAEFKGRTYKHLVGVYRQWDDLLGGRRTRCSGECYYQASKKVIELCQKDLEQLKRQNNNDHT
jgi:hypothetical protein